MISQSLWSHPHIAAQVVRTRRDGRSEVALRLERLHDARQVLGLGERIEALPGVVRVTIDLAARRARVVWDMGRTSLPLLLEAFAAAQCPGLPLRCEVIEDSAATEAHDALKRLLVAGMFAMQVMTYAFVIYIGVVDFVDFTTRGLFRWLGFLCTLPIVLYSAVPFYRGAYSELRGHRLGINLPVVLAIVPVFLASAFATWRGEGEIYFDSIAMFVFLLLAARYVELRSRHRSEALGDAAMDATPMVAQRRREDGSLESVAAIELLPGDHVHVPEGAAMPADGVLRSEAATVDEALLSGEARPVTRYRGERVFAGSSTIGGPADITVSQAGQATMASRLAKLGTAARRARSTLAIDEERALGRFVGRVLLLTAITAGGWCLVDPSRAFAAAIAVLVVACPCAFALAVPATYARALGVLARRGVAVADERSLAALAKVDRVMFDKTGTLTVPHVSTFAPASTQGEASVPVLRWASALARESSHPLARALYGAMPASVSTGHAHAVTVVAGRGIVGEVDGRMLRLGRPEFVLGTCKPAVDPMHGDPLVLGDGQGAIAAFSIEEVLHEDASALVDGLRADGMEIAIISGDTVARVSAIAAQLGVHEWYAGQSPQDKLAMLRSAQRDGHRVLAVGDGSNDVPFLAAADVSAVMATGSDHAQGQADVLLVDGRLQGLLEARRTARRAAAIIVQSRRWSLMYNLCAVPFAALGFVPPWLAGIGMASSSLLVVLNALRLSHVPRPLRA